VEHPAGGQRLGSLPPPETLMTFLESKSGQKTKSTLAPKPVLPRSKTCPCKRSVLRPVVSSIPAFLTHPGDGPTGFAGFVMRRAMTH
jgi:hypothetical protein